MMNLFVNFKVWYQIMVVLPVYFGLIVYLMLLKELSSIENKILKIK